MVTLTDRTKPAIDSREVAVHSSDAILPGILSIPPQPSGLVLFAHGSGSSRFSKRNQQVADVLHKSGIATLLFDLLTPEEERIDAEDESLRFDISLLSHRLTGAIDWLGEVSRHRGVELGLFGALNAAAARPQQVRAVVCRGGRPDLAPGALHRVSSPTLLIVGGKDFPVLRLNRQAAARIAAPHSLLVVPGANHLFEEPGTLRQAADLATDWFQRYLNPSPQLQRTLRTGVR
jgi:putative phosphoribosyl transferase